MSEHFLGSKDPKEEIRNKEIAQAFQEAKDISEKYNLSEEVEPWGIYNTIEILPEVFQRRTDSAGVILRVSNILFPQLIAEKNAEYIFERTDPTDNTGGYDLRKVWFNTENKLRVLTETYPIDGGFMENIVYPSYLAQLNELSETIGDKEITLEETRRISRKKGFSVFDPVVNSWVSKIKLLSPQEAERFKGALFGLKFTSDDQ